MDLYGQEPEVRLLASFLPHLDDRTVIDVGAERGAFTDALLRAGSERVYALEPEPSNVEFLRDRFRGDARVSVHGFAVSDSDGEVRLRRAVDSQGAPDTYGHTLLDRPNRDEIGWRDSMTVTARSIATLVAAAEIPTQAGILKADTEGHDLQVIAGMGPLACDVVVVEH